MPYQGDMLISWRVTRDILGFVATPGVTLKLSLGDQIAGWLAESQRKMRKICWWKFLCVVRLFFWGGIGNKRLGGSKNKSRHIIIMMMIIIIIFDLYIFIPTWGKRYRYLDIFSNGGMLSSWYTIFQHESSLLPWLHLTKYYIYV